MYSADLKDDSEMQIQMDLQREDNPCVEDEEEGFLGQEFAFVQEAMWLRALKWSVFLVEILVLVTIFTMSVWIIMCLK